MRNVVVILNFNDSTQTIKTVCDISDYQNIERVIIVDNNSTDDSATRLYEYQGYKEKVDIICTDRNGGYAYGNNVGCRYAIEKYDPEILTIANPDVSFSENTLEEMLETARNKDNCGVVGCMMNCHSSIKLPSAWRLLTYVDCMLENLILLKRLIGDKKLYEESELAKDAIEVDAIAGSFFCICCEAYKKCRGFDENTFLYYEETILAKRLKDRGYKNYLLTKVNYEHYHSVSIDKEFNSKMKRLDLAYKSRRYYMEKYLRTGKIGLLISDITYSIGRFDYMAADWIRSNIKGKKHE